MIGATDPESTYDWSALGNTESTFDFLFQECPVLDGQTFNVNLLGLNFEDMNFGFYIPPGTSRNDAVLVYLRVSHDDERFPQP